MNNDIYTRTNGSILKLYDFLNAGKAPYVILNSDALNDKHQSKEYQLAQLVHLENDDNYIEEMIVSLACNGNYVCVRPREILAIANNSELDEWETLYGIVQCKYHRSGNYHEEDCLLFYDLDNAIDDITNVERVL